MNVVPFWTVSEVAAAAGVAPKTIYHHIEKGALRSCRVGPTALVRIPHEEAQRYLQARCEPFRRERVEGVALLQAGPWAHVAGSADIWKRVERMQAVVPLPVRVLAVLPSRHWRTVADQFSREFDGLKRPDVDWFLLVSDMLAYLRDRGADMLPAPRDN